MDQGANNPDTETGSEHILERRLLSPGGGGGYVVVRRSSRL